MVRLGTAVLIFALGFGCGSTPPQSDPVIPIAEVPSKFLDVARKELPGFTFDTATS
jgi:hypothetical protein